MNQGPKAAEAKTGTRAGAGATALSCTGGGALGGPLAGWRGDDTPSCPAPRGLLARGTMAPSRQVLGPPRSLRLSAPCWGSPCFRCFKHRKQQHEPCSPPDDSMLYIHSEERTERVLFSKSIKGPGFVKIEIARHCLSSGGSPGHLLSAAQAPGGAQENQTPQVRRPLHSAQWMRAPEQRPPEKAPRLGVWAWLESATE